MAQQRNTLAHAVELHALNGPALALTTNHSARGVVAAQLVSASDGGVSVISVDRIARIRIQLDDIEPSIWRRVDVPLTMSLKRLHDVIQAVMLFEDYHLFEFEAGGRCYDVPDPEDLYERKLSRLETHPHRSAHRARDRHFQIHLRLRR
nr:plasmid pRiA4b ORF-3 family protein [Rhizobium mesosinicum]